MSGPRAGPDPGGQLYGDHQPAAGDDGVGSSSSSSSVFFQNSARDTAVDTSGGTTPYSSITDYLQGFMEPPGHLDAPPVYAAEGDMIDHDGRHGSKAAGGSATPITPNTSTSSEPRRGKEGRSAPDDEGKVDEEAVSADHQNHRSVTTKKKKEKKERGSRVAFATKSEVDHLDDGYRWRKYGQKAVKNSSFPRSYYRCTTARCGVKKQVERSQHDPSTVVTTYEGQHAHPSPAAHRGMATGANGLYSLATLQQQRHGFCPSSPDDLLLAAAARAMAPPAAAATPAALLPRQAENRLGEYYGLQLQDPLLDDLRGHR